MLLVWLLGIITHVVEFVVDCVYLVHRVRIL